jgi:hypothetical protein
MARREWIGARSLIIGNLLAVAAVAVFSTAAHASAAYRVWYFDDNFDTFDAGDVTDGLTTLVPPAWACGIVFDDPSYYRWVDSYGVNVGDGNFNKDVRVWLGKPGCSESLNIEYADNSQSFPHVAGGSYMEITTNYGLHWIDNNGSYPSCVGCVGPDQIVYFPDDIDWAQIIVSTFKTVDASLVDSRLRSRAVDAVNRLSKQVAALLPALQEQVTKRRRAHLLGDLEGSVRPLEDAAIGHIYFAGRLLSACSSQAQLGKMTDAFVFCEIAGDQVGAAGSLIKSAQSSFQLPLQ